MLPLIIKYLPKTTKDILGQDEQIAKTKQFLNTFKGQKKKALLLYGPSGIGKTASACALANELDLEIVEVNASDTRNADQIQQVVGAATKQQSLFMKQKLILIDEIDGLSGMKDRGGIGEIVSIIEETKYPIILTATNPWDNKFSSLRKKTDMVEFDPLDSATIFEILKKICDKEKIKYEDDVLRGLARRAGNDARAAINDLQTLSIEANSLTKDSLEALGERNKMDTMLNALCKVFKTTDPKVAISAFDMVEEDTDEQFLWLDENLPHEYTKPEDLARAYDRLSKADVFRRRIRRWQHWRFLIYINALITAGIATAKTEKYKVNFQYKPTGRILKIWWANQKNMKKKAIAEKLAQKTHTSKKSAIQSMPYFREACRNNKDFASNFAKELDLNSEEVEWLRKL